MDHRNGYTNSTLDIQQLFTEAKHRWLRPIEVCEILRNYQQLTITAEAPTRPSGGSLYLFDRKVLRFFRKDGHRWRKKKDGKTVREAHEKLKAGNVDVLHCYYAHGEDHENFQRRSYWMLETPLDRIVLVHYRDVKQAYKGSISHFQNEGPGTKGGFTVANSFSWLPHDYSPLAASNIQSAFHLSQMNVIWNSQTPPSVVVTENTINYPATSSFTQSSYTSITRDQSTPQNKISGFTNQVEAGVGDSLCRFKQCNSGAGDFIPKITDSKLDTGATFQDMPLGYELKSDLDPHVPKAFQENSNLANENQFRKLEDIQVVSSTSQVYYSPCNEASDDRALVTFQKLDSFGRWMNDELGKDCDDSIMASDSGKYWSGLDNEKDGVEVSSLSHHMHLDVDSFGPSLNQEQLFTICDFSPDWAYSGTDTKVLITGTFLVDSRRTSGTKWSCMFGEIEVSTERLTEHVLRCHAPSHDPGHVPFYVTCSNRLACSEIREFHYRENPNKPVAAIDINVEDEVYIQVRLAKILCSVKASKRPGCSDEKCDRCQITQLLFYMWGDRQCEWTKIEENISSRVNCIADLVMQRLLEDKLYEWLIFKLHEGGTGVNYLDKLGQGVIHLAAALGYEWAMRPIIAAGISPNFRDTRGRTALHWASYYGREESVIALVKLGAAAGAVEDPTPAFPGGSKAADLASTRGYKGIAGYLAEVDLISHLSSMTINSHANGPATATTLAQNVSHAADQFTVSSIGFLEELSLRKSLDAVKKSAHAVASIHSMLRSLSLKQKQSVTGNNDISKAPLDLVLAPLLNVQKVQHFDDYLHVAAEKLQNKYRAWKKRREFLKMRSRIVKIQAHYRGHQVRKQYKKVIWSVGIVEKAILRWRRKGSGLRGFRVGKEFESISPDKVDEYEFLRIGRAQKFAGLQLALSRVKSMSRNPAARDQYMRLLSAFENFKDMGTEYLVRPIGQAEDEEDASDSEDMEDTPSKKVDAPLSVRGEMKLGPMMMTDH